MLIKLFTITLATLVCMYFSNAWCINEDRRAQEPIDVTVSAQHTISINGYNDLYRCVMYFGDSLKACMETLSPEEFRQNFKALSAYNRRHYLETLTYEQHVKMLKNFTEKEWQGLYDSLQPQEQTLIPSSKKEQEDLLNDVAFDTGTSGLFENILCVAMALGDPAFYLQSKNTTCSSTCRDAQHEQMYKNAIKKLFNKIDAQNKAHQ